MIRIVLGQVGSGKTAMIVREMFQNSEHQIYSNIITRKIKNNNLITPEMIFKKEVVKVKRDGTPVHNLKLNVDYWKQLDKSQTISVVLDEAHTLMNPRRSMSKKNIIMSDFVALLRRVVGSASHSYGELILITQLERRLDVIAKEMCSKVQYCRCYYVVECHKCGYKEHENNETPEKLKKCPVCDNRKIKPHSHIIEVFCFTGMDKYNMFKDWKIDTFYDRYFITDINMIFDKYDTLQWDNLITDD